MNSFRAEKDVEVKRLAHQPASMRFIVLLLGAAGFIVTADVRVVNPLLHVIATEFKSDVGTVGFIVTAYTIPYGLFQLVYGPLGDRIGKLRVMTVAMGLFAVGTAACALAPNLFMLNLLRFLTGMTAAALIPLSIAYIGDNVPYERRQAALAQYMGMTALGQILSTSLGGIVADFLSWRYIFLVYGLLSLGIGLILWRTTRSLPDQSQKNASLSLLHSLKTYAQLMKTSVPRLVIITVFIEGIFFFGGFTYLGAFLRDEYHLLYITIGFILGGFGLGTLVYSGIARQLLHRLGENGMVLIGGILIFLSYLLIALIKSWPLFILLNIVLGTSFYMLHNTLQTKATEMAPESRGVAVSLFAFSLFIGQGIGAAALGPIVDGPGYELAFLISGLAMLLLCLWFIYRIRRLAPEKPQPGNQVTEQEDKNLLPLTDL